MKKKIVHAEIEYTTEGGVPIHSDLCPPDHDFDVIDEEYIMFLKDCLDEWLRKSGGTGIFYIAQGAINIDDVLSPRSQRVSRTWCTSRGNF